VIYADFIQRVGIDDDQIESLRSFMRTCPFVPGAASCMAM
jgi:hypothetical protein